MRDPFDTPSVEFTARLPAELNERLRAVAHVQRTSKNSLLVAAAAALVQAAGPRARTDEEPAIS
jgi:predicted transcriptional regulator